MSSEEDGFINHLEALRRTLLSCLAAIVICFPVMFWLAPNIINALVAWCCPESLQTLHYFSPMEVFWVQMQLALVLALVVTYPWSLRQIWSFLLPALYPHERQALGWWVVYSSILFFGGIAFCIGVVLPMLMQFSGSFAAPGMQPLLGLGAVVELAGWLMLAFGVVFQTPVLVLLAVRFGLVSSAALRDKRPYVMTGILILAGILTPPDVLSQLCLAIPTWLLFEIGLVAATHMERLQEKKAI